MKKILLSAAFLAATITGVTAQQISFEASEGYVTGDINGQNGWTATPYGTGQFVENQVISNELSSVGSQSLKIVTETAFAGQNSPVIGAFRNLGTPISDAQYTFSFDINISELEGADFAIYALSEGLDDDGVTTFSFVNRVLFNYQANLNILDVNTAGTGLEVVSAPGFTWTPTTWYNLRIEGDNDAETIECYINDVLVYTGSTYRDTAITDVRFVHDNWGGFAYIDNFKINDETASVKDVTSSTFSIYPNPAKDVINVANSADTIENVTITDMNGRVVKQVALGVNEGQINISDLSQGVYILNATSNGKSVTEKIVKQ